MRRKRYLLGIFVLSSLLTYNYTLPNVDSADIVSAAVVNTPTETTEDTAKDSNQEAQEIEFIKVPSLESGVEIVENAYFNDASLLNEINQASSYGDIYAYLDEYDAAETLTKEQVIQLLDDSNAAYVKNALELYSNYDRVNYYQCDINNDGYKDLLLLKWGGTMGNDFFEIYFGINEAGYIDANTKGYLFDSWRTERHRFVWHSGKVYIVKIIRDYENKVSNSVEISTFENKQWKQRVHNIGYLYYYKTTKFNNSIYWDDIAIQEGINLHYKEPNQFDKKYGDEICEVDKGNPLKEICNLPDGTTMERKVFQTSSSNRPTSLDISSESNEGINNIIKDLWFDGEDRFYPMIRYFLCEETNQGIIYHILRWNIDGSISGYGYRLEGEIPIKEYEITYKVVKYFY